MYNKNNVPTTIKHKRSRRIFWHIDHVCDMGICPCCGKDKSMHPDFIPNACDAHTHGMNRFGHLEFQYVLNVKSEEIAHVLNSLCNLVASGRKFYDGDYVTGIYDDCSVLLKQFKDDNGGDILRVIVPDGKNRFPGNPECWAPYKIQLLPFEMLLLENHDCSTAEEHIKMAEQNWLKKHQGTDF